MNRLFHGPFGLKIGLSILTRRGGIDANASESLPKARWQDLHVGILAAQLLEKVLKIISNIKEKYALG